MKIHRARVTEGKLVLEDRPGFMADLKEFEGRSIEVIVRDGKPTRSTDQNALYWTIITKLARHTDHETKYLHEYFKERFLVDQSVNPPVVRSTRTLNTDEFTAYLEEVIRVAAEQGVVIEEPPLVSQPRHLGERR